MSWRWVVVLVGILHLVWGDTIDDTCASFALPDPSGILPNGAPSRVETRVLWGESYCRKLTLGELDGKTPKLCVRNQNPKDQLPTGCVRLTLRHVNPGIIKKMRVGIHPDCNNIPIDNKYRFQRRRSITKPGGRGGNIRSISICFDDIPATETCCETKQCLVFEAVLEIAGASAKVTTEDDACNSEEGCPYSIDCPNLIDQPISELPGYSTKLWYGTDSNDVIILPVDTDYPSNIRLYGGDNVVIGSSGPESVGQFDNSGKNTLFLKDGNDTVFTGTNSGEDIAYLGKGDDELSSYYGDGVPDKFYGGRGNDEYVGDFDESDILKGFETS
ncbi:hypothetical protein NDN08_006431 [Rhodosorus marinus]|uniref:Uncharacterized protein n=1 Tax=Rhodosorus marinus TaxID=101924 RepID=A0AAV8UR96_9RHOD|nr:hypothetical protein NDN08_006431 [Rhodosorus marinus]